MALPENMSVILESSQGVDWWRFWEKEYETEFHALDNGEPYSWVLQRIDRDPVAKKAKEIWFWKPYEPKKDESEAAKERHLQANKLKKSKQKTAMAAKKTVMKAMKAAPKKRK